MSISVMVKEPHAPSYGLVPALSSHLASDSVPYPRTFTRIEDDGSHTQFSVAVLDV